MTTAKRTPKQTAGNNAFLKATRKLCNDPIYRATAVIVNGAGVEKAAEYLRGYFRDETVAALLKGEVSL